MIYVFDLDGTLCNTQKNKDGYWDYMNAKPYQQRIDQVNALYSEGHTIIIDTARGCVSKEDWYQKTYSQIVSWGIKFHQLRTGIKFGADCFVDDKAINIKEFFKE